MKTAALTFALLLCTVVSSLAYDPAKQPLATSPDSAYEKGRVHIHNGEMKREVQYFRLAVDADPKNFRAYTLMGYSLRHLDLRDEAVAAYDKALAVNPAYAEAIEYRGITQLLRGNRLAAMRDYRKLVLLGSPLAEDLKKLIDDSGK